VCLGHQCIGQAFGAEIVRAKTIMHGKTSLVVHRGLGVFKGLPQSFEATRYHSLVIKPDTLPEQLEMLAWTEEDGYHEIMGVKHSGYNIQGVQFHPESILTRCGHDLLRNFLVSISPSYNA
jgi:anthranilate synthase component 2